MKKQFYVYIMTNAKHSVLYTGVTSRYHINLLVYYEEQADAPSAIAREKQIKGGSRQDKINMIDKNESAMVRFVRAIAMNKHFRLLREDRSSQ